MSRCTCACRCKHDAGSVALCLPCAANRRAGTTCAKVAKQTPEEAAGALSLAVRKVARNEYAVPSASNPGNEHIVCIAEDSISCPCAWGFRVGAIRNTAEGLSARPCRHVLAVAARGARYEPLAAVEAFRLLGGS